MKFIQILSFLGPLALFTGASNAAEGQPATPDANVPTLLERPIVVPTDPPPTRPELPAHPNRPPARPAPPESVAAMIKNFKEARKVFLANQAALRARLKEGGEEERDAIREELKDNLKDWIRDQRERAREHRLQVDAIRERLDDAYDKVLDEAKEGGRD